MIHMNTTRIEMATLIISADVNRPHIPSEILLVFPQGLSMNKDKSYRDTDN